jgi:hypothetical protein
MNYNHSPLLSQLVGLAIASGVIPAANKALAGGFPLPNVPGLTFLNPAISWGANYMMISTDFTYSPPSSFQKDPLSIIVV